MKNLPLIADSEIDFSILKLHVRTKGPIKYCKLDQDPELKERLDYLGEKRFIFQPLGESTLISITDKGREVLGEGSERDLARYHTNKLTEYFRDNPTSSDVPPVQLEAYIAKIAN